MQQPLLARRVEPAAAGVLAVVASLFGMGLVAIARAEAMIGVDGKFLARQSLWAVVAAGAIVAAAAIDYRRLAAVSYALLAVCLVLLAAVYLFPAVNGARRWIRFGSVGFQPSEFTKLAFVLALARYLMYRESYRALPGLMTPLLAAVCPIVLILREPDLGTALVFPPVLLVMLYAAGARTKHLLLVVACGIALTPILWTQMSREQKSRVSALLEQTAGNERPSDDGYHLHQAKGMLAAGSWFGSVWQSTPIDDGWDVPEPHTDSIASVVVERFGLVGLAGVLLLYVALFWCGLRIAEKTREPFGRLLAIGVVSLIAVQALINLAMMVGLAPITGLALPLVSYGGSSLVANCVAIGLLVNVALRPGYNVGAEPFRFAD